MSNTNNRHQIEVLNRRAEYEYYLIQKYQAGIILTGTEVKSARAAKVNISDAFCYFLRGELYIKNLHISEYKQGTYNNHEPKRVRKLLLNKQELKRLEAKVKERGFTIVPVRMFVSETGFLKIEIALSQGKKHFNKRDSIKEKDQKRDLQRELKG